MVIFTINSKENVIIPKHHLSEPEFKKLENFFLSIKTPDIKIMYNTIKRVENQSLSDSCRQIHPRIVLRRPVLLQRSS